MVLTEDSPFLELCEISSALGQVNAMGNEVERDTHSECVFGLQRLRAKQKLNREEDEQKCRRIGNGLKIKILRSILQMNCFL